MEIKSEKNNIHSQSVLWKGARAYNTNFYFIRSQEQN